jgi:hypothetical protein
MASRGGKKTDHPQPVPLDARQEKAVELADCDAPIFTGKFIEF